MNTEILQLQKCRKSLFDLNFYLVQLYLSDDHRKNYRSFMLNVLNDLFNFSCDERTARAVEVHLAQAQAQPQAAHPLHHAAVERVGEEVPREAVPLHCRARRILQPAQTHRDASQDLVSEQKVSFVVS